MMTFLKNIFILGLFVACAQNEPNDNHQLVPLDSPKEQVILTKHQIADKFDYPVGKPNAKGYYNAQKFGENQHLGEDWNAVTGGNSDLGDPIFAIANGQVTFAQDIGGGWGNVIRVTHQLPNGQKVESLYAHCDSILAQANQWISRGQQIGTIGTAHGHYIAHLHFEIRDSLEMPIGGGYGFESEGYVNPSRFIKSHR